MTHNSAIIIPQLIRQTVTFFLRILLTTFFLVCLIPSVQAQNKFYSDDARYKILILNSYHHGFSWSDDEQAGILTMLQSQDANWMPYVEYLDSKRYPDKAYSSHLKNIFSYKYSPDKFSLIMTIDTPALEFALENQNNLFQGAPIVFCGVNNFTPYMLRGHSEVTGVAENLDPAGTIEVMLKLHPKTREIIVITDNTITGLSAKYEMDELMPLFSDKIKIRYLNNSSLEEVLRELKKLPQDTLVFERSFLRDRTGRSFALTETTELFSRHSPVPVYGAQEQRLGHGIVGGKLLSGREHGAHAARIALRVLAGEKASNIPVFTKSDARYMFDYKVLLKFGIPLSSLPKESIIINKPVSFFTANKPVIISALAIIFFLFLVIIFLIVYILQRRNSAYAITRSDLRYKELADSIADVFFALDKNLKYTYWNKASEKLMGITAAEAIGKSLFDLFPDTRGTKVEEIYRTAITTRQPQIFVDVYRQNDRDYFLEISVYPSKEGISVFTKDITRRKNDEEAMKSRSNLLYSTIDSSIDYIFVKDLQLRMILCNKAFAKALGKTPAELHGKTDIENGWDPEMVYGNQEKGIRGFEQDDIRALSGRTVRIPSEPRVIGGNIRFFNTIKLPLHDSNGSIIGMLGVSRDITDRKQVEDAIKESEEQFRLLAENAPEAIYIQVNEKIAYANAAFCSLIGADSCHQILGKSVFSFFHPAYHSIVRQRIRSLNKNLLSVPLMEQKYLRLDNTPIDVEVSAVPFRFQGNNGALVFARDITERKIMEAALSSEKERLLVTLRSIGDGVITTDTEGNITLMNKVAEELTGWKLEEAVSRPLLDVFHIVKESSRKRCENPFKKVMQTGGIVELAGHTVLLSRNGQERIIADSGAPIRDKFGEIIGLVLVFRDISEKQKAEEALQNAERLESIGVLAGGIAHDFNNLLGGLFGYIEMARDYSEQGDMKHVTVNLAKALTAFDRAKNLTQQLLTFAKGGTPILKTQSINRFVRDTVKFVLSGSKVLPVLNIPDNIWLCDFDENQIAQVIDNIIINARQSMPLEQKIEVSIANITRAETTNSMPERNFVRISIRDFGTGISREHLSRIFDPFFTTKHQGSGLGLATCYSIIKKHNGFIEVESILGSGTTFHIFLPASPAQKFTTETTSPQTHHGSGKILIMDDEEYILDVLSSMLKVMGYETALSTNGDEAIELASKAKEKNQSFIAAILDLTIPGGRGGKETVYELIKIDHNIKVIASSGYSEDPVIASPTEYGFAGTLIKPYRQRDLVYVMQTISSKK